MDPIRPYRTLVAYILQDSNFSGSYCVLNNAKDTCLGSIYIDPSRAKNFDCEVHFWLRTDRIELEEKLFEVVISIENVLS